MAASSKYLGPLAEIVRMLKEEEDQSTRNEAIHNVHGFMLQVFKRLDIRPQLPAHRQPLEEDELSALEPRAKRRRLSPDPATSTPIPMPIPRPLEDRLLEDRLLEDRPLEDRPLEDRPLEDRPLEERPDSPPRPSTGASISPNPKPSLQWVARVPISAALGCEDLTAAARQFADELLEAEFEERRNNRLLRTQLKAEDVRLLVTFLFSDVFGDGCRERIYALIDELTTGSEAAGPLSSGVLASSQAADPKLLPEVRAFFATYSTWHQGEVEQSKIYPTILQSIHSYQLYVAFARLRTIAAGPDGHQLRDFLAQQGFCQSRGVDIRTCILRYLCRELQMPANRLNNALQAQLGIYYFVKEFGPGVLVLLPKVASYRIARFGSQKIQVILRRLRAALPDAVTLCATAETNILNPILRGERIPLLLPAQTTSRQHLSLIEAVTAITPGRVNEISPTTLLIEAGQPSKSGPVPDPPTPSVTPHKGRGKGRRSQKRGR